jgi:hypothetical protein
MNEDQLPIKTKLTDYDLLQHANDLLDYTLMAHVQPISECLDRFRWTFGPVVDQ